MCTSSRSSLCIGDSGPSPETGYIARNSPVRGALRGLPASAAAPPRPPPETHCHGADGQLLVGAPADERFADLCSTSYSIPTAVKSPRNAHGPLGTPRENPPGRFCTLPAQGRRPQLRGAGMSPNTASSVGVVPEFFLPKPALAPLPPRWGLRAATSLLLRELAIVRTEAGLQMEELLIVLCFPSCRYCARLHTT